MNRLIKDKKLVIKPDDVFLVSYPRSGNTWVRYLLANLLHPSLEWHIANLNRSVPDIHQETPNNYIESQPRIFKSHHPYCQDYPRAIYICRDGRDVSLSYYYLRKKKGYYKKEFREFLLEMLQGQMPYGSWQDHIRSWVLHPHQTPLLVVKYEQLFKNTTETLRLLCDFLRISRSDREIEASINKSTFEKQKRDLFLYKYDSHWVKGYQGGVKGAPGKWLDVFDNHLNELFWKYAGDISERLGYPKTI